MPCVNGYDTITQADGTPLDNHYDYPDSEHFVTSYCRTADGTWIAWINRNLGDSLDAGPDTNKADWPAEIASANAIGVGYFPDDGSAAVVYELGIEPIYTWQSNFVPALHDPCSRFPLIGDWYADNGAARLTGWAMGVLDVQVRTDGSNVWVVVLARESVKYLSLFNAPSEIDNCGATHETFETLWASGHDNPFTHDYDSSGGFWLYRAGNVSNTQPFGPYDDAGDNRSFRWQPARVTVFAGDIGGFTAIDTVEAKFDNYDTGLVSGIEVAASPAEPGVCHVLWAEAGNFGIQTVEPQRGQRINYSQWDFSSKTLDTDLLYTSEDGSGFISDANWVWTAEMILRNDHGSPIAIVWPWVAAGGPLYPGVAEFWDLSSGTANTLQTMDPTVIPTLAETGLPDVATSGLLLDHTVISSFGTARRTVLASSLYIDPRLTNQNVYLFCVGYYSPTLNGSPGGLGQHDIVAFFRIPCDGSATFDYLDGTRELGYSIVSGFSEGDRSLFAADFVSDPDDVWMPSVADVDGGGALLQLDRQCLRGWTLLPAFPIPDPLLGRENGSWAFATSPPSLVTDGAGDWIYGGGTGPTLTVESSDPTNIAALKAKICRCCQPCNRTGMHVWEII